MLWLVGMMGSGKSTIGRRVAAEVGLDFIDIDELIASVTESSIADLWEQEGEEHFRALETQMIDSAASSTPMVAATGGGVVLDARNVDRMRQSGTVIWLEAKPATLGGRVGSDSNRPLLAGAGNPEGVLTKLLADRRGRYAAAAHHRVDTDGRSIDSVVGEVLDLWNRS